jgi:hypothetical protein
MKVILVVRFEVLTAKMMIFWVVTPCRSVGRYQRFGETTETVFLRNAAMYLKVHTALQPGTTSTKFWLFEHLCVYFLSSDYLGILSSSVEGTIERERNRERRKEGIRNTI